MLDTWRRTSYVHKQAAAYQRNQQDAYTAELTAITKNITCSSTDAADLQANPFVSAELQAINPSDVEDVTIGDTIANEDFSMRSTAYVKSNPKQPH